MLCIIRMQRIVCSAAQNNIAQCYIKQWSTLGVEEKWTEKWETKRNLRREMENKMRLEISFVNKKKNNRKKTGEKQEKKRRKNQKNRKLQEIQKQDKTRFRRDKISAIQDFGKC